VKKTMKKLSLNRETLHRLEDCSVKLAAGGGQTYTCRPEDCPENQTTIPWVC